MELSFLAFTDTGYTLACRLAEKLGGEAMRCGKPESLSQWTEKRFTKGAGLVYVGAAGIAVRAIAPFVEKKWKDPAVVVIDEAGRFVIPLLSGHLGGANDLARRLAKACGAQPVITTATDVQQVFSVDDWARAQHLWIPNPHHIKNIAAMALKGEIIRIKSVLPVSGDVPPGVALVEADPHVSLSPFRQEAFLSLVPRQVVLGIGCRKGISEEAIEEAFRLFCETTGLYPEAVRQAASIDLKKEEPGLLAFCQEHHWPFTVCTAQQLESLSGEFTPSAFVHQVTGVDNVCERSAVFVSGGNLCCKKFSHQGVTLAAALSPVHLTWSCS